MIEKKPFVKYSLEEKKRDIVPISLNPEERSQLEEDKKIIRQAKDGTAMKQLAAIGSKVIHGPETKELLDIIFNNLRKNKRTGLNEF